MPVWEAVGSQVFRRYSDRPSDPYVLDAAADVFIPHAEVQHFGLTTLVNVLSGSPLVFLGSAAAHSFYYELPQKYFGFWAGLGRDVALSYVRSRGSGAPSDSTPPRTVPSKRRQGRASAEPGKYGRTPSPSGGKESRARRKKCPKGHYWSYKKKKCMKSKFRR